MTSRNAAESDPQAEVVDLLIIGGGTSGIALARAAAARGDRVALVERDGLGGTAAHSGDLPLATLRAALAEGETDLGALRTRIGDARTTAAAAIAAELAGLGVEVITGAARFVAPRDVFVSRAARTLTSERIVLALGTEPDLPNLPGLIDALPLTTTSVLRFRTLPDSLLVIGGGTSGIEFATLLADLGVAVTLVERAPQLLPGASPAVAAEIADRLAAAGVSVHLGHAVGAVMRRPDGQVQTTLAVEGRADDSAAPAPLLSRAPVKIMTEEIVVATGRSAATASLGLDLAGVELERGGMIRTDAHLATTAPGIWALGEVTGRVQNSESAAEHYRAILGEPAAVIATTTVWTAPPLADIILGAPPA